MWQDDSEATNASSGSTLAGSFHGAGTTCGLGEAGTVRPPSKLHSCARLYWPLAKSPSPVRRQRMVALYVLTVGYYHASSKGSRAACCAASVVPSPLGAASSAA